MPLPDNWIQRVNQPETSNELEAIRNSVVRGTPLFLFHTLLELLDSSYRTLCQFLPRETFFQDLRALTRYLCFESWQALMAFMIKGLELEAPNTS